MKRFFMLLLVVIASTCVSYSKSLDLALFGDFRFGEPKDSTYNRLMENYTSVRYDAKNESCTASDVAILFQRVNVALFGFKGGKLFSIGFFVQDVESINEYLQKRCNSYDYSSEDLTSYLYKFDNCTVTVSCNNKAKNKSVFVHNIVL